MINYYKNAHYYEPVNLTRRLPNGGLYFSSVILMNKIFIITF